MTSEMTSKDHVEVVVIGGGLCGVLAGHRCTMEGLSYTIIEREDDFGGVWGTLANKHSHLQAFEAMYRWHEKYPLGSNPLSQLSSGVVLDKIRQFATDFGLKNNTLFGCEVLNTKFDNKTDRFTVEYKQTASGGLQRITATFLMVTTGILGEQYSLSERNIKNSSAFKGSISLAGRHNHHDCPVGSKDAHEKVVVILGTGAFACEAMEAAHRNGAEHVYMVSRPRQRWVLPFSRQFTTTFVSYAPLIPWSWKMTLLKSYLSSNFYRVSGLQHMIPTGEDMDYTGQCNDAFFNLTKKGKATFLLDKVESFTPDGVLLRSGTHLKADTIIVAAGCKFTTRPKCLEGLNTGYDEIYNYAFLGPSARIGTASDFVYAFVPHGPKKQLDMFFHGIKCFRHGSFKDFQDTLKLTGLPTKDSEVATNNSTSATWFETRHYFSNLNKKMQDRNDVYHQSMTVGISSVQRAIFRWNMSWQLLSFWMISGLLAFKEIMSIPVYKDFPAKKEH